MFPEKTMELWTADALVSILGQNTWIWSPVDGADQLAWDPSLRKLFVLELKAPDVAPGRSAGSPWSPFTYFRIDLKQLDRYATRYESGAIPDVVYVLPSPRQWNIPSGATDQPLWAHPNNRRSFPTWTYAVRASELHEALGRQDTGEELLCFFQLRYWERWYWDDVDLRTEAKRDGNFWPPMAMRLSDLLFQIDYCDEPQAVALRASDLVRQSAEPGQVPPDGDRELTAETAESLIREVAEASSPRTKIVGSARPH